MKHVPVGEEEKFNQYVARRGVETHIPYLPGTRMLSGLHERESNTEMGPSEAENGHGRTENRMCCVLKWVWGNYLFHGTQGLVGKLYN